MIEAIALCAAGVWAGAINVIVGSGTLVTFPTLLLFGYPPLTANISNNLGMVAGGISGVYGYRRELRPNRAVLIRLAPASIAGALVGAALLLVLPDESFKAIVPVLIALGLVMVIVGPAVQRRTAAAQHDADGSLGTVKQIVLAGGIFILGIYGGYFGAAQGILLVGLMGLLLHDGIQRLTAIKNVLATMVNSVAAILFVIVAADRIDWSVVGLISAGSFVGGYFGARFGRRLSPTVLRACILVIGTLALIRILVFD
ncbi:sulfite exporter TauE/SafE family protein [Mycolicibacterium sp. BiH015]|uniref:sulfite exporter TauE/SafE family protein n=1 Tax=Mycolicibacterium sp. BiH015 TaxID=3018808 RepID=UPI0022E51852|nr:sulfite exporter TauE/SafE family protein [Mycolicibacterium sp. BiH015]MDA2892124.1 sulfite exporter TauE/SafE family protein [Mycolicibacterium sp. BiH015]